MARYQLGGGGTCCPLIILESRHASDKARLLSVTVCLRARFSTFSATYWSRSREDIPRLGHLKKRTPPVLEMGVDGEEVNVGKF